MARTNKIAAAAKKLSPVRYAEYKQLIADNVIYLVSSGISVAAACKEIGVERANITHWAGENKEFAQQLARAREEAAFLLAESTVEIARDKDIDPKRARNIIQAQQWLAGKYNPNMFGDKQRLEVTHKTHEEVLLQLESLDRKMIDVSPVS